MLLELLAAGVTTAAVAVRSDHRGRRRYGISIVCCSVGSIIEGERAETECQTEREDASTHRLELVHN